MQKVPVCVAKSGKKGRLRLRPTHLVPPEGADDDVGPSLGPREKQKMEKQLPCAQVAAMMKAGLWDVSPHRFGDHNPLKW